jgi:hypothetical protein
MNLKHLLPLLYSLFIFLNPKPKQTNFAIIAIAICNVEIETTYIIYMQLKYKTKKPIPVLVLRVIREGLGLGPSSQVASSSRRVPSLISYSYLHLT